MSISLLVKVGCIKATLPLHDGQGCKRCLHLGSSYICAVASSCSLLMSTWEMFTQVSSLTLGMSRVTTTSMKESNKPRDAQLSHDIVLPKVMKLQDSTSQFCFYSNNTPQYHNYIVRVKPVRQSHPVIRRTLRKLWLGNPQCRTLEKFQSQEN